MGQEKYISYAAAKRNSSSIKTINPCPISYSPLHPQNNLVEIGKTRGKRILFEELSICDTVPYHKWENKPTPADVIPPDHAFSHFDASSSDRLRSLFSLVRTDHPSPSLRDRVELLQNSSCSSLSRALWRAFFFYCTPERSSIFLSALPLGRRIYEKMVVICSTIEWDGCFQYGF
ncbi:hypothetical protein CEXT_203071 [Caerostris extrusa]|uniref:Uncharacterized protein n=1 Tax=Caerostris extrusa TaxID=172846 RepID=A0AAV4M7L9_CAEEX|nr:hypothetical protein CEXT_203071 [Caerostris extrusa]